MNTQQSHIKFIHFVVVFFAIWSIRATFLYSIDESLSSDFARAVYSTLVKAIIWGGLAYIFSSLIRRASPLRYLRLSKLPTARSWVICLIIAVVYFSLIIIYESFIGEKSFAAKSLFSVFTISDLVFLIVSPFLEELVFRGVFLKEFISIFSTSWANIVTSLLFVGIHLPFWIAHNELDMSLLINCVGVFIFSLIAGWLYIKSNSIWPSTIAHIANNLLSSSLVFSNVQ